MRYGGSSADKRPGGHEVVPSRTASLALRIISLPERRVGVSAWKIRPLLAIRAVRALLTLSSVNKDNCALAIANLMSVDIKAQALTSA